MRCVSDAIEVLCFEGPDYGSGDFSWTAARSFVNSSEVTVIPGESKIMLSEIFKRYEGDFGGRQGAVDFLYDYLVDSNRMEKPPVECAEFVF
ncbi:MAG: hypothetical protein JRI36_05870 [Deltaproteobacteria bacterium]|nr:hypothetical protein [Deltaproteobacteria bacterium]